jgi:hypothetical protein
VPESRANSRQFAVTGSEASESSTCVNHDSLSKVISSSVLHLQDLPARPDTASDANRSLHTISKIAAANPGHAKFLFKSDLFKSLSSMPFIAKIRPTPNDNSRRFEESASQSLKKKIAMILINNDRYTRAIHESELLHQFTASRSADRFQHAI